MLFGSNFWAVVGCGPARLLAPSSDSLNARDVKEVRTLEAEARTLEAEARTLEAEARTLEAEARTFEAKSEAMQFSPSKFNKF